MAACRPKLNSHPGVDLFLSRFAESEWRGVVRPWLERGRGGLERAIVVAPTRGQTHALKQRCLAEGVALLGVEFLTPGLARRKRAQPAGIGRSLQILVLRTLIEARLAPLAPGDPARGVWSSLSSDLESALSDFEELVRGGFEAGDFPRSELRDVFGEMAAWVERNGYALGPRQDVEAGLAPAPHGLAPIADRILILAGGAEGWGDFFGLAALTRRCAAVTVVLAEPEFAGRGALGEEWVEVWQAHLGVEPRLVDASDPVEGCGAVAELWAGAGGSADRAEVIVGRTRSDEMERVASAVQGLLDEGSDNIAVIFPGAGASHARLVRLLGNRGIAFADLIGTAGTPPVDTRIQRALVDFYDRGCRVEELLALWPLLRSLGMARATLAQARSACQRLFDEVQSHAIEPHVGLLEGLGREGGREAARVARLLLPGWPRELSPADALARFEAVRDRLTLSEPAGWAALRAFAARVAEPMPARALLEAIRSFLPEAGPAPQSPGAGGFARVTLTTCRRAAGVAWSDAILVESNSGIWPERREPSCWIGDDGRRALNSSGRFSLGVPTGDDRAAQERRLLCAVARDTRRRIIFSAARFDEEDPELKLGPNAWLERVMWSKGLVSSGAEADGFGPLGEPTPAGPRPAPSPWFDIWLRRRDPAAAFDEFFLADPTGASRPGRLSAIQVERGIEDPARLWFDAVLGVARVGWGPFSRARRKSMGTAVHRVLAEAMRGAPAEGDFFRLPARQHARSALAAALGALRARWPADCYWDSFHMDVSRAARELLERVYGLPAAPFAAVEVSLPKDATIALGGQQRISVHGRMDLVLSDRPGWAGARVEIVDFKTGGDPMLSARRMESTGASLQLGVYLQAALSVGATGSVWMLKPEKAPAGLGTGELGRACAKLLLLGEHLRSGVYGARTPDRGEHTHGFEWPLACAPIASAVLEGKFAATFGAASLGERAEDADE